VARELDRLMIERGKVKLFSAPFTEDCPLSVASRSPLHVQAATLGFVVLAIPQPVLGQSGRRKGFRLKFRRCYPVVSVRQPDG